MLKDFAIAGLTASGGQCLWEDLYRQFEREGTASMRFFCFRTVTAGGRGAGVFDQQLAEVAKLRYHDGNEWMDNSNYGERFPGGGGGDVLTPGPEPIASQEAWDTWGRFGLAAAKAGVPVQLHTVTEKAIDAQLDQVEKIAKQVDIRPLRWAFMHMEAVTPAQVERMKKLNMFLAINPREVVSGGLLHQVQGDKAFGMPPLKEIQDSGIMWGFGTDAFEVNQFRPFQTLYWAVTGKMVGGTVVNTHTISREAALIAHTRSNAYLFFRENDLGSIQPGRFADLVVTDKDYLTVPAEQIKDIKSVLTVVGGRIVYDAAKEAPSPSTQVVEGGSSRSLSGVHESFEVSSWFFFSVVSLAATRLPAQGQGGRGGPPPVGGRQGDAGDHERGSADRAAVAGSRRISRAQDHRQSLLHRHGDAVVVPDHDAAGEHRHQQRLRRDAAADEEGDRVARLQDGGHEDPARQPRASAIIRPAMRCSSR